MATYADRKIGARVRILVDNPSASNHKAGDEGVIIEIGPGAEGYTRIEGPNCPDGQIGCVSPEFWELIEEEKPGEFEVGQTVRILVNNPSGSLHKSGDIGIVVEVCLASVLVVGQNVGPWMNELQDNAFRFPGWVAPEEIELV